MRITILLLLLFAGLMSFIFKSPQDRVYRSLNLPNCIEIAPNFYCDLYEITNFSWLEYLHWNKKVFGANSLEYQAALPDSTVWLTTTSPSNHFAKHYLRSPMYRDYPVVGISQTQAKEFAQWRSNRVFELKLIRAKLIRYERNQNAGNYFTIDRYFQNELSYAPYNARIVSYPKFRLPSSSERKLMLDYNDVQLKRYKNPGALENKSGVIVCDTCTVPPTWQVTQHQTKKLVWLYQLNGNVAEWLDEQGYVGGQSWNHDATGKLEDIRKSSDESNSFTGFRCIASWEKWIG